MPILVPNAAHHKDSSDESMRPIVEALASIGVDVTDCRDGENGTSPFYVAMFIQSFAVLERIAHAIPLQFSSKHPYSRKFTLIIRSVENCLDVILEGQFIEYDKKVRTSIINQLANCIRSIAPHTKENS